MLTKLSEAHIIYNRFTLPSLQHGHNLTSPLFQIQSYKGVRGDYIGMHLYSLVGYKLFYIIISTTLSFIFYEINCFINLV